MHKVSMLKMTIDDLMNELEDARINAKENGQASAMVSASMSKAKILGMLDKTDSEYDNEPQPIQVIVNVKNARKADTLEHDKTSMQ